MSGGSDSIEQDALKTLNLRKIGRRETSFLGEGTGGGGNCHLFHKHWGNGKQKVMILLHYSLRPRKLPWILTCYEFCRYFFPPFRKLQNFSGCINCHCVGYKEVHLWSYRLLVPWISSDDRRGGDFWDPNVSSVPQKAQLFHLPSPFEPRNGFGKVHQMHSSDETVSLLQGSVRCRGLRWTPMFDVAEVYNFFVELGRDGYESFQLVQNADLSSALECDWRRNGWPHGWLLDVKLLPFSGICHPDRPVTIPGTFFFVQVAF